MHSVQALLFDLDGTLVDTSIANFRAYQLALEEVGVEIEQTQFQSVAFGRNWRQFLPAILQSAQSDAEPAAVAQRKREIYPDLTDALRFNQGLFSLALASRSTMRTAVVTTASSESVSAVFKSVDQKSYFDILVTGDDVLKHKPAPDAYLLAAERLGVNPSSCLAFEDSDIGVESARAAGMMVVRVSI